MPRESGHPVITSVRNCSRLRLLGRPVIGERKRRRPSDGYAGWAAGQLENEIQHNGWLHCDADPDLIFGADSDEKYLRALRKIGIDPGMLSNEAGHA